MASRKVSSLKEGHSKVRGDALHATPAKSYGSKEKIKAKRTILDKLFPDERAERLKDIPLRAIRDAWYISAHLLLDDGSHVVDMGCGSGEMVYALSLLKPEWKITAIDVNKDNIAYAKRNFKNNNLTFVNSDISNPQLEDNSVDAIINSYVLHEIYSEAQFNTKIVRETLEAHYRILKTDGYMYIRDHTTPGPGDYVMIELKQDSTGGDDVLTMSEADLLVWFSDNVRSGDLLTTGGFYLEELPARFPNTRLFRLPHKWAYEFILRKDDRERLSNDMNTEYTFATQRDLRRECRSLGGRLVYCTSDWDDDFVKQHMIGHFKLYKENGDPLGYPETSYTILLQKVKQSESVRYQEWRTSRSAPNRISVQGMRDNQTGDIVDIASRNLAISELIPFYVNEKGQIKVFLQERTPRSIINTVPRKGKNIDGKQWSGHMIEALSFDTEKIKDVQTSKKAGATAKFVKDQIGIEINKNDAFIDGPCSYPAPKSIDERVETKYIEVNSQQELKKLDTLGYIPPEGIRFNEIGKLKEFDAQMILNAINVGMIPSARLEVQLLRLYEMLGKKAQNISESPLVLSEMDVKERLNIKDTLADIEADSKRFSPIKNNAGTLRVVHSIFMEEGQNETGGLTDISSIHQDFFVSEDDSQNIAVVIPMVKDLNGEVMMGLIKEHAPVPERLNGKGTILNVPSFPIPTHIEDMESARRYVAEMFEVDPKYVGKIGEPFFQHIGMTPKKMFPFAVTSESGKMDYEHFELTNYAPLAKIWDVCALVDCCDSFIKITAKAYQRLLDENEALSVEHSFSRDLYLEHTSQTDHDSDFLVNSAPATTNKKLQVS